jgi:hypothetical protein
MWFLRRAVVSRLLFLPMIVSRDAQGVNGEAKMHIRDERW